MVDTTDSLAADIESRCAGQPWVLLRFIGRQDGFGLMPSRDLYNVVAGDYTNGSTVTLESMKAQGFWTEILK